MELSSSLNHKEFHRRAADSSLPAIGLDDVSLGEEIALRLTAIHEERLESGLKASVWGTYKFLFATLLASHVQRDFSLQASQTTGHLAVRLLCAELSMSPMTAYDHLDKLRMAGLLDYRSFKVSAPADWSRVKIRAGKKPGTARNFLTKTLNTGTLIAIRLRPGYQQPVQLRSEDFEVSPRDLHADLQVGNTVANYQASLTPEQKVIHKARRVRWNATGQALPQEWMGDIAVLVNFSLPTGSAPDQLFVPVQFPETPQDDAPDEQPERYYLLEDIRRLGGLRGSEAAELVGGVGDLIRATLGDTKGATVWYDVLWRLHRHARSGDDRTGLFHHELGRVVAEDRDGELRNPAAALIRRLSAVEHGFWEWLQGAPPRSPRSHVVFQRIEG